MQKYYHVFGKFIVFEIVLQTSACAVCLCCCLWCFGNWEMHRARQTKVTEFGHGEKWCNVADADAKIKTINFKKKAMNNIYSSWIWISQLGAECACSSVCVVLSGPLTSNIPILYYDEDDDDNYHNRKFVRASTYLRKFFRFMKWNENRYNDSNKATKKIILFVVNARAKFCFDKFFNMRVRTLLGSRFDTFLEIKRKPREL